MSELKQGQPLRPGRQVQLRVRAANARGWGAWSEPLAVTTAPAPPSAPEPPAPSNRTASGVRLRWSMPAEDNGAAVTGYVVELAPADASGAPVGAWEPAHRGTDAACRLAGLAPGSHYAARVSAVNTLGQGPPSAPAAFRTALAPPPPPAAVSAELVQEAGAPAAVLARWTPLPPGAGGESAAHAECSGYEVEAVPRQGEGSGAPAGRAARGTCSARAAELSLMGLAPGTYTVRVRAVGADSAGHGEWSDSSAAVAVPAPPASSAGSGDSDADAPAAATAAGPRQRRRGKVSKAGEEEAEAAATAAPPKGARPPTRLPAWAKLLGLSPAAYRLARDVAGHATYVALLVLALAALVSVLSNTVLSDPGILVKVGQGLLLLVTLVAILALFWAGLQLGAARAARRIAGAETVPAGGGRKGGKAKKAGQKRE